MVRGARAMELPGLHVRWWGQGQVVLLPQTFEPGGISIPPDTVPPVFEVTTLLE